MMMRPPRLSDRRYRKFRERILQRDLYQCRYGYSGCTGVAEDVEHLHQRSWGGGTYDEANAFSVCKSCHREKERRLRSGEWTGVFSDSMPAEMRLLSNPPPPDSPIVRDYSRKKAVT